MVMDCNVPNTGYSTVIIVNIWYIMKNDDKLTKNIK